MSFDQKIIALTSPGDYSFNGWLGATPNKFNQGFIYLVFAWHKKLVAL